MQCILVDRPTHIRNLFQNALKSQGRANNQNALTKTSITSIKQFWGNFVQFVFFSFSNFLPSPCRPMYYFFSLSLSIFLTNIFTLLFCCEDTVQSVQKIPHIVQRNK